MIDLLTLAGVDPYDALRSPRLPSFVQRSARLRQVVVQVRKRVSWDLSKPLGIEPFVMAKTVGCFLSAVAREHQVLIAGGQIVPNADGIADAEALVELLDACEGNIGDGAWGYEFDVQTRWAFYPKGSPNLIATVFVVKGLLEAGLAFDRPEWIARAEKSVDFLVSRLLDPSEGFFRYTEESTRLVHNANLLGSGLVASVGALANRAELLELSLRAARVSVDTQDPSGWWVYGRGEGLGWIDSFHTAYDLDGLLGVWSATGDHGVYESLERGVHDWTHNFFGPSGEPHYYRYRQLPFEIHSAATAVDLLARLSAHGFDTGVLAERVLAWTRRALVRPDGQTFFRIGRFGLDRRHFVRWGDAHWRLAEASASCMAAGIMAPLEAAVLRSRS